MEGYNWLGVAELAIAIVGVLLAIYFYQKGRPTVQLSQTMQQTQLLGISRGILPDEISISYNGRTISNLAKINLMLWNSGNVPIRHQDIIPDSPITINMPDKSHLLK